MTVIFLHIPKTGGTSLKSIMRQQVANGDFVDLDEWYKIDGQMSVEMAAGHAPWGCHQLFSSHRYLTMIRHPVDRIVSLYHYINQLTGGAIEFWKSLGVTQRMPLLDFVRLPIANLDNGMVRQLVGLPFYYEQTDQFVGMTDYKVAKENLKPMCIGLTEKFAPSAYKFAREFGWKISDIPHLNKVEYPRLNMSSEAMFDVYQTIRDRNEYDILIYHTAVAWSNL